MVGRPAPQVGLPSEYSLNFLYAACYGQFQERREYLTTEWDPTATSDLDALRSVFDTNGDGKLTSADAGWGSFKVLVTKADGTTEAKTLAQLGIELPECHRRHPFLGHFQPNTIRAIGAPL